MEAMNYVKPELIVVAFVLYFFGVALRQAQAVKNKYIPLILGGISMVLCAVWVMATSEIETAKEEGRILEFEFSPTTGRIEDMWGPMFGAEGGSPYVHEGFGKVVSMTVVM